MSSTLFNVAMALATKAGGSKPNTHDPTEVKGKHTATAPTQISLKMPPKRHIPSHKKPNCALTFPEKLMNMMDYSEQKRAELVEEGKDPDDYCLAWMPDGESFLVRDPVAWTTEVVPLFFRQCKFTSITRKLYRWGFRQVSLKEVDVPSESTLHPEAMVFVHEFFQRDSRHKMANMTSNATAGTGKKRGAAAVAVTTEEPASKTPAGNEKARKKSRHYHTKTTIHKAASPPTVVLSNDISSSADNFVVGSNAPPSSQMQQNEPELLKKLLTGSATRAPSVAAAGPGFRGAVFTPAPVPAPVVTNDELLARNRLVRATNDASFRCLSYPIDGPSALHQLQQPWPSILVEQMKLAQTSLANAQRHLEAFRRESALSFVLSNASIIGACQRPLNIGQSSLSPNFSISDGAISNAYGLGMEDGVATNQDILDGRRFSADNIGGGDVFRSGFSRSRG